MFLATSSKVFFTLLISLETTKASACFAIALCLAPPSICDITTSSLTAYNNLPSNFIALALCLIISIPECPPLSPDTSIFKAFPSAFSLLISKSVKVFIPPAQLTKNIPSSSPSILIIVLPSICSPVIAIAPSIPVSSAVVASNSIGG